MVSKMREKTPKVFGTIHLYTNKDNLRAIPFKNGEGGRRYFFVQEGGLENVNFLYTGGLKNAIFCIGDLKNAFFYRGSQKCHFVLYGGSRKSHFFVQGVSKKPFFVQGVNFLYRGYIFLYRVIFLYSGVNFWHFFCIGGSNFGHFLYRRVKFWPCFLGVGGQILGIFYQIQHFLYRGVKFWPFLYRGSNVWHFLYRGSNFVHFLYRRGQILALLYKWVKTGKSVVQGCPENAFFCLGGSRKFNFLYRRVLLQIGKISSPSPFLNGIALSVFRMSKSTENILKKCLEFFFKSYCTQY